MRTPKQIAASRSNGARSKGPITPEGKRNSSKNSTRHGMFADTLVLETEDPAQFHELLDELLDEHQPSTPTQTMLVETVVAARWRQRRIWGIQKTNFDYDIASVASTSENPAQRAAEALRSSDQSIRSHELLLRFEIALDRQISRSLLRLQQLQDRAANKVARHEPVPAPAPIAPHCVEPSESAKGAARTSGAEEDSIARRSVLRDSKEVKRTQQPVENTTRPNSNSRPATQPESPANRRPTAPQQNTPAKRSVPSI